MSRGLGRTQRRILAALESTEEILLADLGGSRTSLHNAARRLVDAGRVAVACVCVTERGDWRPLTVVRKRDAGPRHAYDAYEHPWVPQRRVNPARGGPTAEEEAVLQEAVRALFEGRS